MDKNDPPPAATTRFDAAPSAASPPRLRPPALRKTSPVKLFAPLSTSVPAPALVSPAVPARMELMVAVTPALVVIVGRAPPSVSVPPFKA
ncbi:hypothetical protein D3C80_1188240 [compost metagenome]